MKLGGFIAGGIIVLILVTNGQESREPGSSQATFNGLSETGRNLLVTGGQLASDGLAVGGEVARQGLGQLQASAGQLGGLPPGQAPTTTEPAP